MDALASPLAPCSINRVNSYLLSDQSESIKEFAQRFVRDSSFYNAYEELIILRYSLSEKIKVLEGIREILHSLTTSTIETSSPDPQQILSLLKQQATISSEISSSIERVVKTLKTGAEIDLLVDSRLDGVQLLYILESIPKLMSQVLRAAIINLLHKYNILIVETEISTLVDDIIDDTIISLKSCPVLSRTDTTGTNNTGSVTLEELGAMIETVPHDS